MFNGHFLRYLGSKRSLIDKVELNMHGLGNMYSFVDVFGGGANIISHIFIQKNEKFSQYVYNDKNPAIINLLINMQKNYDELFFNIKKLLSLDYEIINITKNYIYNNDIELDVLHAAYFYMYLEFELFYGKKISIKEYNKTKRNIIARLDDLYIKHQILNNIVIENLDCIDCINKYDKENSLLFIDPPYDEEESTGSKNYLSRFSKENHINLLERCKTLKSKAIITHYDNQLYNESLLTINWSCRQYPRKQPGFFNKEKSKIKQEKFYMNF